MQGVRINAEALTAIRERSGYSKSQLASMAGMALSYLSEIESGDKPGSPKAAVKLATALACPLGALLASPESNNEKAAAS